uniref:Uncharacterized protein n=1 Tax=Lotus japonicus TaxID=34305 RepID=I3SLS3_LOTJA|nr:unknown [Lotus japonicus]
MFSMNPLKTYQHSSSFFFSIPKAHTTLHTHTSLHHSFLSLPSPAPSFPFRIKPPLSLSPLSFPTSSNLLRVSNIGVPVFSSEEHHGEEEDNNEVSPDLSPNGPVLQKTLQLVECSMFAALTGLVYFLSNSLAIENYFSCFFSLPIVISSMRWGVDAGKKTLVSTTILLFVLSGPVKALTYLLKHV